MPVDVKLLLAAKKYHESQIKKKQDIIKHENKLKLIEKTLKDILNEYEDNVNELLSQNASDTNRSLIRRIVNEYRNLQSLINSKKIIKLQFSLDQEIQKQANLFKKFNINPNYDKCRSNNISDILYILFSVLKDYDNRPRTRSFKCQNILIRHFENKEIPYNINNLFNCINQSIQTIIYGTFLISRYPDAILSTSWLRTFILIPFGQFSFSLNNKNDFIDNILSRKLGYEISGPETITALTSTELGKYLYSNKRFIIIPVHIVIESGGSHANILIYDSINKTIEYFEPQIQLFNIETNKQNIKDLFGKYVEVKEVIMVKNWSFKTIGNIFRWQSHELLIQDKYKYDPVGYCFYWSILYAELRLLNPDISGDKIHDEFENCIKRQTNYTIKDYIRLYFTDIFLFIREFLYFCKKINIKNISDITLENSKLYLEWKYKIKY